MYTKTLESQLWQLHWEVQIGLHDLGMIIAKYLCVPHVPQTGSFECFFFFFELEEDV